MSNQNGLTYQIDPETGYTQDLVTSNRPFTAERKKAFVAALKESATRTEKPSFNLSKVCNEHGIHYSTFTRHFQADEKFRHDVDELRMTANHRVESTVYEKAVEGKSPMWNAIWLNNNYGEKYGPKLRLHSDKNDSIKDIWGKITAIDAEIVGSASIAQETGVIPALDLNGVDNQQV